MMPKFFLFTTFDRGLLAICDRFDFGRQEAVPADFGDALPFHLEGEGRSWPDVLHTRVGVMLFSERCASVFQEQNVAGIRFYEAPISKVDVDSPSLNRKPRPPYYWGRASGMIEFDQDEYEAHSRFVPLRVSGPEGCEVFHYAYPRGPGGYACRRRVLDVFRAQQLSNLFVIPSDYYEFEKADPFKPPFRIDLLAKKWPPKSWYPAGFLPHPKNCNDD
jgi:hypothetical protein